VTDDLRDVEGEDIASAPAVPSIGVGSVVDGRFEILYQLGEGGMGAVFRARQLNLDRDVALKVLLSDVARRPDAHARFEREARVASMLKHPNAVEIYDVGEHEGVIYLAMELLRGQSLWEYMGTLESPPPLDATLGISAQVADVLIAAHHQGVVHRDLKPENIFLEDQGDTWRVVVVDFGLAFVTGTEGALGRMTREGLVVGTPPYLSPEQANGGTVGPASDVYSLGCVLYELLTGYPPFLGSELHVLTQHLYVAPMAPSERAMNRRIPRELDELTLAMLRKKASERPTPQEVRDQLELVGGTLAGRRARGRDASYLKARAERMVSVPPEASREADIVLDAGGFAAEEALRAGTFGRLEPELVIGLRTNGIAAQGVTPTEPTEVDVILAATDDLDAIRRFVGWELPVVAVADVADMKTMTQLVRLGVAEVVRAPLAIDNVVRRLRRAHDRHARSSTKRPE
jgi:hypothetical protein